MDKNLLFKNLSDYKATVKRLFKLKYNYNTMDADSWSQFDQASDRYINSIPTLARLQESQICLLKQLNSIWTQIRDCIIQTAKECILHHKVANNSQ